MNVFLGKITMKQLCAYKVTGFIIFFSIANPEMAVEDLEEIYKQKQNGKWR